MNPEIIRVRNVVLAVLVITGLWAVAVSRAADDPDRPEGRRGLVTP